MRKNITFFSILVILSLSVNAQVEQSVDDYIFKVEIGKAYTPINVGTCLKKGLNNYKIPMGFTVKLGDVSTDHFSISFWQGFAPSSDTIGQVNAFMAFTSTFFSVEEIDHNPLEYSLCYDVTGVKPNRIFKFQAKNLRFQKEKSIYGTLNDFVNFQVWLYEGSHIVEMRYGESRIVHSNDYFYFKTSPMFGFMKKYNHTKQSYAKCYVLIDSFDAPNIDSTSNLSFDSLLNKFPTNGTVYRFIPKAVAASIGETTIAHYFNVYPTIATNNINVDYNQSQKSTIEIFASNGQLTKSGEIERGTNTIDISALATGNYVLKISNDEGNVSYKFVKQ
jgi:hypothetical protein